jgi:pimeloyl-ACP methyl ester carboxylesterase
VRFLLLVSLAAVALAQPVPIVFVHGNGDDAAKWMGIVWLFESNGYPRERLYPVRLTKPSAPNDDAVAMANRSSTVEQAAELSAAVTRALLETGASKVALVGSSRGGNAIRNYLKFAGGAAQVSHAILCGTPNHGVLLMDNFRGNEFNGKGTFLERLNEGSEVVAGVKFLTLRSDKFDKYAQPQGAGYESPALAGALNMVLPQRDHREVAFHPEAFAAMYEFLTGGKAQHLRVRPEATVKISGLVTGFASGAPTNLPEVGVRLTVYALEPETAARAAQPLFDGELADGAYGPLEVDPRTHYEFVLQKAGKTLSYFKSPFARSFSQVNLRFAPLAPNPGKILVARPQGYWSQGRDALTNHGQAVAEVPAGLPTLDSFSLATAQAAKLELRGEVILARPGGENSVSIADFLWE